MSKNRQLSTLTMLDQYFLHNLCGAPLQKRYLDFHGKGCVILTSKCCDMYLLLTRILKSI